MEASFGDRRRPVLPVSRGFRKCSGLRAVTLDLGLRDEREA